MKLYDNTRLSDYKRCPRLFYYRHIRHWISDGRRTPLVFGGAWHSAMEVIWAGLTKPNPSKTELAKEAYLAFVEYWVAEGLPPPDEIDYELEKDYSPRTPAQALEMIVAYIDYRMKNLGDFELISMEKPFAVPLDERDTELFYIGKIDKVIKRRGKFIGIEHKTTTAYKKDKHHPFRATFVDSFSPNAQVDGYLYAMHMMFPDLVGGVWVDAALVHKQEEGFMFIPVERQLQHLDSWIWDTRQWINRIEEDKDRADISRASDTYMKAFPKNTNSCWDFNAACSYLPLCKAWSNPRDKPIPAGFTAKKWDPLEHIGPIEGLTDDK